MSNTLFNIIQSNSIGGGMENIFLEYSNILNKNDFNIVCLVSKNFCHLAELRKKNIKIEILNISGHFDIISSIKLYFLIKKYSPKIIIGHNGRVFATVNLCKKIFNFRNIKTLAVSHGGNIKRIMGFNYIISVANHIKNNIEEKGFRGKVHNIYNGYKASPSFKKLNKVDNKFIFGMLSRLSSEKKIDEAIKSFKQFHAQINQNSSLLIAGDGPEMENLKTLTKTLDLEKEVKFIGWINSKEGFFNKIDIFLQTADKEPFGITILEAFNYKTTVIASDACGPKEIIRNEYDGYLFENEINNSLFLTMKKAFLNSNNLELTDNATKTLKTKFSYEIMEKNLVEFISQNI